MSTTAIKCGVCGKNFSADAGDVDPETNQGFCNRCISAIPITGKTAVHLLAVLDDIPGNRKRATFEAKRLGPNGVAMRASNERKLARDRRAQQREENYGFKTPWKTSIQTVGGKVIKPQRREVRDRRDYLAALDRRQPDHSTLPEPEQDPSDDPEAQEWIEPFMRLQFLQQEGVIDDGMSLSQLHAVWSGKAPGLHLPTEDDELLELADMAMITQRRCPNGAHLAS